MGSTPTERNISIIHAALSNLRDAGALEQVDVKEVTGNLKKRVEHNLETEMKIL